MLNSLLLTLIALFFSLDSLVKLPIGGLNIHVGLILCFFVVFLIPSKLSRLIFFIKVNPYLAILTGFLFFDIARAFDSIVYAKVLSYILTCWIVYFCIFYLVKSSPKINYNTLIFLTSISLLSVSLFQFGLYKFFDYQINLGGLKDGYYNNGGSISTRLRGAFLEPNWIGVFTFYFSLFVQFSKALRLVYLKTYLFSSITILIILLFSENRLILGLYLISFIGLFISKLGLTHKSIKVFIILSLILLFFIYLMAAFSDPTLAGGDRSISARSLTLLNTVAYLSGLGEVTSLLFGVGFSNWGTISNEFLLSVYNFRGDQLPDQRDTAELQVFLLELGVAGLLIIIMDTYASINRISKSLPKGAFFLAVYALSTFLFIGVFYPLYTFSMSLTFYLLMRSFLLQGSNFEKRY